MNTIEGLKSKIKVLKAENKGLKHKIKYLEKQLEEWKRINLEGY